MMDDGNGLQDPHLFQKGIIASRAVGEEETESVDLTIPPDSPSCGPGS
jgi:hypothetical protein